MMQKNDLINDRGGCRCDERETPRYVKCGCGQPSREPSWGLRGYPVASVYSVLQEWKDIYDLDTALKKGTIFGELDLPFYGSACGETHRDNLGCGGGRNGR